MRTNLRTAALAATLLVAGVLVWALLLAPVVISIHRFMVLEEVTRAYVPVGEPTLQAQALGCIRERPGAHSNSRQCGPEFGAANPPADAAVIAVTATDKSE